jgi:hypothetical protein
LYIQADADNENADIDCIDRTQKIEDKKMGKNPFNRGKDR